MFSSQAVPKDLEVQQDKNTLKKPDKMSREVVKSTV